MHLWHASLAGPYPLAPPSAHTHAHHASSAPGASSADAHSTACAVHSLPQATPSRRRSTRRSARRSLPWLAILGAWGTQHPNRSCREPCMRMASRLKALASAVTAGLGRRRRDKAGLGHRHSRASRGLLLGCNAVLVPDRVGRCEVPETYRESGFGPPQTKLVSTIVTRSHMQRFADGLGGRASDVAWNQSACGAGTTTKQLISTAIFYGAIFVFVFGINDGVS